MENYDFCGWATRNNVRCSDGRTIIKDAFKHHDGQKVPLVWNHQHNDAENVLGHAVLENRDEGVYAYGFFNDTPRGQHAKLSVQHGDVNAMSIYATRLDQHGPIHDRRVMHGTIREVSLVLAGLNPDAFIETVMYHGEVDDEDAIIYTGEEFSLFHADSGPAENTGWDAMRHSEKPEKTKESDDNETVADIFNTLSEKQKSVVYAMIGQALGENAPIDDDKKQEGDQDMKHNVFDNDNEKGDVLMHAEQQRNIIGIAKSSSVGSLQAAISIYNEENQSLKHGIDDIESLFPEHKDVRPGAPELIQRDQGWVTTVMQKTHKSPISRIRTRQADVRGDNLRAFGYQKGKKKDVPGNIKLLKRTTDPQTVYRKDALNRDDIVDIVDFDVVEYQYGIMRQNLNEELALAIMIGDGREEGDDYKISEDHIRSIWNDDDLYTIHTDLDIEAARDELQGTDTTARFGDNYVYAEAIITAALYSRERYKGSGTPDFYCTPHLLNVMLLARDLNGRRIYDSKSDLAAALNVGEIHTAEQFEGQIRTTKDNKQKKLLGIFVNLSDYQIGSTKGGEITRFNQFDIDFNQEKYLIETRVSGALTRVYSAIALEEDMTASG